MGGIQSRDEHDNASGWLVVSSLSSFYGQGSCPTIWKLPPCPVGASFRPRTLVHYPRRGRKEEEKIQTQKGGKKDKTPWATCLGTRTDYRLKAIGGSNAILTRDTSKKLSCHLGVVGHERSDRKVGAGTSQVCPDATQRRGATQPWSHEVGMLLCAGYIPPKKARGTAQYVY